MIRSPHKLLFVRRPNLTPAYWCETSTAAVKVLASTFHPSGEAATSPKVNKSTASVQIAQPRVRVSLSQLRRNACALLSRHIAQLIPRTVSTICDYLKLLYYDYNPVSCLSFSECLRNQALEFPNF
ncbi:hypothetical protein ECG_06869 [Echinococcus granulosus]|nr:hypothetical protein ECG_06869 [Echinococcus granulosus]